MDKIQNPGDSRIVILRRGFQTMQLEENFGAAGRSDRVGTAPEYLTESAIGEELPVHVNNGLFTASYGCTLLHIAC
jgi:hypothetical protein